MATADAPLEGRVALITGCAKPDGIGGATARRLGSLGYRVVVSDIGETGIRGTTEDSPEDPVGPSGLQRLAAEVVASGGSCTVTVGDIASEVDARRIVDEAVRAHGRLDVLVNNASAPHGAEIVVIDRVPLEAWEQVMAVNARGTFLMCRAAVPAMRAHEWGRIVNISSVAARTGLPMRAAYSASKSALLGLTRSVAMDVAGHGITVNAICPGPIRTSRTLSSIRREGRDEEEELARRVARVPVGRMGTPEDVAAAVAFFASEDSGFVTGQALNVDGGMVMI